MAQEQREERWRPQPAGGSEQERYVLPRWQPDTDVTHCPVCKNSFTFWYRKHHCRKCGRVVCANCSPHRITIPRQFIVRPPEPPEALLNLVGDSSPTEPTTPLQLWGGEEVRVCNPCVPDPNLSPPPQPLPAGLGRGLPSPDPIPPEHWRFPGASSGTSRPLPRPPRPRNTSGPLPPLPPMPPHAGHRPTHSDVSFARPPHSHYHARRGGPMSPPGALRDLYNPPNQGYNFPPRLSSSATASGPSHIPNPYHNRTLLEIGDEALRQPQVRRRVIAEEDECPVCSEELAPKGPDGDTTERERHVTECIQSHLYTSTPPSRTTSAPPEAAPGDAASSEASGSVPSAASVPGPSSPGPSASTQSVPLRPRRMTGGRMLVYRATEKDCTSEDGTEAECVICFEEFEPGDEMGRLECLCRFHRLCIRQWWDTKGIGSCPTHQLHD